MTRMKVFAVCIAVGLASQGLAHAQDLPKRKLGLWEVQISSSGGSMPNMQESLANMPPDKRAQVEAMMKQRGMSFGAGSYAQTMRYCLTAQMAAEEGNKPFSSRFQRDKDLGSRCEEKVLTRTSTEVRFHAVCRAEDGGMSEVDGRIFDISPESVAVEFKGKSAKQGDFQMQQKARWIGSDCGNVK